MVQVRNLLVLFIATVFLVACSEDRSSNSSNKQITTGFWQSLFGLGAGSSAPQLTVLNEKGEPVGNAKVLIGANNMAFDGNFLVTDRDGHVAIPAGWKNQQPVTIQAEGYVRATFMDQDPVIATFKLHYGDSGQTYELNGQTTGYENLENDGWLDVGLIIPALSRADVFNFDLRQFVSPEMDTMTVFTKDILIPSNVAIPEQEEHYYFNLTLAKEQYRIFFNNVGAKKVIALHARFPFEKVVDGLRAGKPLFDMINFFKLQEGSIEDVNLTVDKQSQNLAINKIQFPQSRTFIGPQMESDKLAVGIALSDMNGTLVPSDVKRVESGQSAALSLPAGANPLLASVLLKKEDADPRNFKPHMSIVLKNFKDGMKPNFLPLVDDPRMEAGRIVFSKPSASGTVAQTATVAILSKVKVVPMNNGHELRIPYHQWEVYSKGWVDGLTVPQWPSDNQDTGPHRWEVSFIGSETANSASAGPAVLDNATHVTHSYFDF